MRARFALFVCSAIAGAGCSGTDPEPSSFASASTDARQPRTIESFQFIGRGTTLQQVMERLGTPDRDAGSGIHIYVYRLTDGTEVWVGSPGSEVWYVRHGSDSLYERR
jgi:hypothetical protein